jgi:hypothetical protein
MVVWTISRIVVLAYVGARSAVPAGGLGLVGLWLGLHVAIHGDAARSGEPVVDWTGACVQDAVALASAMALRSVRRVWGFIGVGASGGIELRTGAVANRMDRPPVSG